MRNTWSKSKDDITGVMILRKKKSVNLSLISRFFITNETHMLSYAVLLPKAINKI